MNILITGATSGIGKQLALDFMSEGHQIWAVGRTETALLELQDKGMHTGQLDLTDRDQSLGWFKSLSHIQQPQNRSQKRRHSSKP